ncbi:MAG TPA: LuxR C-terminal-related transcriptional regulator, partial [Solirubrobacterales bacterium]|nr:LuxR C-terminal-related transcriptional regulator [Solirubrobacterales bacterium]
EFEREFPFGVVRQLLEPPLAEPAAREALLASATTTGAINRDIAQQLFVTPKTVEVHLSNTYRKLGIASRRQLPGALTAAA